MSAETPSLVQVIQAALDERVARIETSLPARVVSYDSTQQRAVVQPLVQGTRIDADGNRVQEDLPQISGVPVAFPRAGNFSITWPIAPGDIVLLVFGSRDISGWLETGNMGTPGDPRRHDLTDAVAIPGLSPFAAPIPADGYAPGAMVAKAAEIRLGSAAASDPVALSTANDVNWDALKTLLTMWVVVPNDGGAALQAAANVLAATGWPFDTSATKVKAE